MFMWVAIYYTKGITMGPVEYLKKAISILSKKPVGVRISPQAMSMYDFDEEFILDSKHKYSKEPVGRFAYNPKTRELVLGDMVQMHSIMIHNQSSSPFDDFVRGVYTGSRVMLRCYGSPGMDKEEIRQKSFDAWYDTKAMLEANGLPGGMDVELGVSTQDIREEVGGYK